MGDLRVIVTGAGAPGIKGTIYSLENNFEKKNIFIIGTDVNEEVVGKYLCDKFYVIPRATDEDDYLDEMIKICKNEEINVLIPQNTAELLLLAHEKKRFEAIGTLVMVSEEHAIKVANNKFELLKICDELGLIVPAYRITNNSKELIEYAKELGWPDKKIVVKPPMSNGQRGVRVIDENIDLKSAFYSEKPSSLITQMDSLLKILGDHFPELIVSEYLPGEEYTVDLMRTEEQTIIIPRKRDLIRSGITFNGSLQRHEEIIQQSELIAEKVGLEFCFGFQFKENYSGKLAILECNPRIQGTMVLSTIAGANLIYNSIKYLLGETINEMKIDWNAKLLRYWGGLGISKNGVITL